MVTYNKQKRYLLVINLGKNPNCVKVRSHLTGSPCRDLIHTGDEIVAIDGLRVKSVNEVTAAVYGNQDVETKITIAREGVLQDVLITPIANPLHPVKVEGKGNKLWQAIKATMR